MRIGHPHHALTDVYDLTEATSRQHCSHVRALQLALELRRCLGKNGRGMLLHPSLDLGTKVIRRLRNKETLLKSLLATLSFMLSALRLQRLQATRDRVGFRGAVM